MFQFLREKLRSLVQLVYGGPELLTNIDVSSIAVPEFRIHIPDTPSYSTIITKQMETPADRVRLLDFLKEQDEFLNPIDDLQLPVFDHDKSKQVNLKQIDSTPAYQPGDYGFVMK